MNVYGSHMGFIWESYANRPVWSVGLFDPEADATYAQAGGAGARPGGVFRKRRFMERRGAYRGPWFSCRDTLTACRIHPEIEEFFCPTWRIIWPGGVVLIDTPRTNTAVTIQVRVSTIDVPWSG